MGIFLNSSVGNTLRRNTANSNTQSGFHLFVDSDSNSLTENTADSNGIHGFFIDRNIGNILTGNVSSNNQNSVFLNSVTGASVSENTVESNTDTGIEVLFSFNSTIFNNNLLSNITQASTRPVEATSSTSFLRSAETTGATCRGVPMPTRKGSATYRTSSQPTSFCFR